MLSGELEKMTQLRNASMRLSAKSNRYANPQSLLSKLAPDVRAEGRSDPPSESP